MNTDILIVLLVVAILHCQLVGWFFAYAYARILQRNSVTFHRWWITYPMYAFLAYGALLDILFNMTAGTVIYLELPREFFYTSRTKRWVEEANRRQGALETSRLNDYRYRTALVWRDRINKIEPGHI